MVITATIGHQIIDADVLGGTIRQAQNNIQKKINAEGDGPLPTMWDPFLADFAWGCYVVVQSNNEPGPSGAVQHLTWSMLNSTFVGLYYITYRQMYPYEMNFKIMVVENGMVGHGHIKLGTLHVPSDSSHAWMDGSSIADA